MKTIEFTDEELKELKIVLSIALAECMNNAFLLPLSHKRHSVVQQTHLDKKLYKKVLNALVEKE